MAGIEPKMSIEKNTVSPNSNEYVEILGDTVKPPHLIYAVLISLTLSFLGYLVGKKIFPGLVDQKMIASYSLLLGIVGNVIALIISSKLFQPKRILTESYSTLEEKKKVIEELQINIDEEQAYLEKDKETKSEMETMQILDLFIIEERGRKE